MPASSASILQMHLLGGPRLQAQPERLPLGAAEGCAIATQRSTCPDFAHRLQLSFFVFVGLLKTQEELLNADGGAYRDQAHV